MAVSFAPADWKFWEKVSPEHKPFVFYFDELREQQSLSPLNFKWYEAYLNNKEDIVYKRYTKDLAKKVRDAVMDEANKEIGDLINKLPDSNKIDSTKLEYRTKGNRIVYGGGGITPDVIVEYDELTNYSIELTRNNIYYQFIRKYLDQNKIAIKNRYKELKSFIKDFSIENQKNDFIKFATDNNVKFNNTEFNKDQNYIFQKIKAYIARDIWGNDGWYRVMLNVDKQFQRAVELFDNELTKNKVIIKNEW